MASLQIISSTLLTFFFFFLPRIESTAIICRDSFCGDGKVPVHFPFRLKKSSQSLSCGYKGFDLSCNNKNQTILSLPSSGDFVVGSIDYVAQTISIGDQNGCLENRLLHNFSLSGSPFQFERDLVNFTFFNCSSNASLTAYDLYMFAPIGPIPCLSGDNYMVFAAPTDFYYSGGMSQPAPSCPVISTVGFPMSPQYRLTWDSPTCGACEARGGDCALKSGSDTQVGCFNVPSTGLSRGAKYGIIIGVGIPGLLCIIGLSCCLCGRVRAYYSQRRRPNIELFSLSAPQRNGVVMGLDGPTIESYPKTLLGESRRLPKPSDNTCSICLSEYQPKETLRSIPECNHYFHAKCIDEWLKLNGTCPVCRNSPEGSAVITPSSLSSPSSSSSSSLLSA